MRRVVIARVEDFPTGSRRIVQVEGREIGVFRVGDRYYGMRNRCPHQGGPLCEGRIVPRLIATTPGSIALSSDRPPLIVCPWHRWQYDLGTGEAYAPGDPHARSYSVTVDGGATLQAETFEVEIDNDYVVLNA
jgi:nitrite reductase/ring-hydroxylating ferredoxin subunit